jgi:membrane protein implicated in regulation of membrane protease activity
LSALGVPLGVDAAVFAALSLGLIFLARPALKRRMANTPELLTNTQALIGAKAVVESTVDRQGGRVRIDGQIWSARSLDETQVLEPGRTVMVVEISGATAVVSAEL